MNNKEIAELLRSVAASYIIKDEKKFHFQIVAYQRAADSIANSTSELKDLYKEGKLQDLSGIGLTMKQHFEELFSSGKVKQFDWAMDGIPPAVFSLMRVPSIGPKKAFKLSQEFKLVSADTAVEELLKSAQAGKIKPLAGFGEKSEADIIRALGEFKEGKGKTTRMVLPFAGELADKLIEYLRKSKDVEGAYTLGSLRRMMATVGDIDMAISTDNPDKAIDYFCKYPYADRIIEKGPTSASLLLTSGQQVDLIALKPSQLGSLLQHFTGSKNHNVRLREYALRRGMSLSERGIKVIKNGKEVLQEYDTEEKFYKALGLDWIPPEIREGTTEIEAAQTHKLPTLVELKDIKGDLHIHSSFPIEPSHDMGRDSMEDMVKNAVILGYEYIGFSEHNPSVSKHTSEQTVELLKKRKKEIDRLQEKYPNIHILGLMETDILTDGSLALDESALELLDATLVSIHSGFSMDKETMTKRVLKGLSYPKAKIFTHPTGRILNSSDGYEIDFPAIFSFVKKHDKAIEINGWPNRLDLSDIMVREAIKAGVQMTIDTDSHALDQMTLMKYGVSVARRGWAEKNDILNTLSAKEFATWLRN